MSGGREAEISSPETLSGHLNLIISSPYNVFVVYLPRAESIQNSDYLFRLFSLHSHRLTVLVLDKKSGSHKMMLIQVNKVSSPFRTPEKPIDEGIILRFRYYDIIDLAPNT